MSPDALWPDLPGYATSFTTEQHAAHRTAKGIHYPENLGPGMDSRKAAKGLLKVVSRPHLKLTKGHKGPKGPKGRRGKKKRL